MERSTVRSGRPSVSSTTARPQLSNLGLGYSIAIALGFLILFASFLLAFYFCFGRGGDYWAGEAVTTASSSGHLSITVRACSSSRRGPSPPKTTLTPPPPPPRPAPPSGSTRPPSLPTPRSPSPARPPRLTPCAPSASASTGTARRCA
ncbi:hypothetical protein Zm00014a_032979 [Zea mays]|uniref:Uncharacterized protein n=1 Tax=Zea mays TaxID=4577 RepID=A0A317Y140_MAIZE|nr:hypothetical protein Zm00014a_032979 [Zea mays]